MMTNRAAVPLLLVGTLCLILMFGCVPPPKRSPYVDYPQNPGGAVPNTACPSGACRFLQNYP